MKRGQFKCSEEIINSAEWPILKGAIDKVFEFDVEEKLPNGIISFHGKSEMFEEAPEGASPEYLCIILSYSKQNLLVTFRKV